ncbi:MAG: CoA transferase [Chloroflexi bacterium]|nr:CoA transferase [Chloroflexota bacterium]
MLHRPLENIRVLELAEGVAGPWAASLLGDLGAEVIKLEAIQRMDQTRGQKWPKPGTTYYPKGDPGPEPWNVNVSYVRTNRNKLSLTLDLSREKGLRLFKDLVRLSDVVMTNMVTGVPEKMGIDYFSLRKIRPDIIMLTSCGFGHSGPYARYVAMAGSMDPISGHAWLRGYEGEDPLTTSYSAHTDSANASTSAFAIVAALHHRAMTGRGQHVDVSGVETMMPHLGEAILDYTMNGRVQTSIGNRHPQMAPHNLYRAAGNDRWVAIACRSERDWQNLCRAMGNPPWIHTPDFKTSLSRWRNREALDAHIEAWTRILPGHDIASRLQTLGVPCSPLVDNKDSLTEPHNHAVGFFETIRHRLLGDFDLSGLGWKMPATTPGIRRPPPALGEDNERIYTGLLGLSDSAYAALLQEALTGSEPLDNPV